MQSPIRTLERAAIAVRHSSLLRRATPLWDVSRPLYEAALKIAARRGVARCINRTDWMRLDPECRQTPEVYEPELWRVVMNSVCPGDLVVEVGAHIGLYVIAVAKRCAPGQVIAFEPDPDNRALLERNIHLNKLEGSVTVVAAAAGCNDGVVSFSSGGGLQSHMLPGDRDDAPKVVCRRLDTVLTSQRIDVLKIDVEGFEEQVLRGASRLLSERITRPRLIVIEVHPYAWREVGTTSETFLGLLHQFGYRISTAQGAEVTSITGYGHILAFADSN